MFNGFIPVMALVRRELMVTLRRWTVFVMLLLVVLILFGTILPQLEYAARFTASRITSIYFTFVIVLSFAVGLFIPVLAGGSIVSEKQQDTYDLLGTSLIPPWALIFGKLLTAVGVFLLLVVACLPIMGVLFFFVGLEVKSFCLTVGMLTTFALASASASMVCSIWCRRITPAVAASFVATLLVSGILIIASLFIMSEILDWGWAEALVRAIDDDVLVALCPTIATMMMYDSASYLGRFYGSWGIQAGWIVVSLPVALWLLRRPPRPMATPRRRRAFSHDPGPRRGFHPLALLGLGPRRAIGDWANAIYAREIRSAGGWPPVRTALGALLVVVIAWYTWGIMVRYPRSADEFMAVALYWQGAMLLAIVPLWAANSFTKEREFGNLDHLRCTLVGPREVVLGKYFAALHTPVVCAAVVWLAYLPAALIHGGALDLLFVYFLLGITWLICTTFVAALGLRISMQTGRTLTSLSATYAVSAGVGFGLPLMAVLVMESFGSALRRAGAYGLVERICFGASPWISPFGLLGNEGLDKWLPGWLVSSGIYVTATIWLLAGAIQRYRNLPRSGG